MEKPAHFREEVWANLMPEQKQSVIEAVTKTVEAAVKKSHQRSQMSELFRIGGAESCDAKKLLRVATTNTSSIFETIDKLENLKETVNKRANIAMGSADVCQSQLLEAVYNHFKDLSSAIEITRWRQVASIDEVIECLRKFHELVANAEEVARSTLLTKSFQSNKARIHSLLCRLSEEKVTWTIHCQRTE